MAKKQLEVRKAIVTDAAVAAAVAPEVAREVAPAAVAAAPCAWRIFGIVHGSSSYGNWGTASSGEYGL